jgi:hypothetical protein
MENIKFNTLYRFVMFNLLFFLCLRYYKYSFTEPGKSCWYESSSCNLRRVCLWRASDLLVWNSVDTTRKTKRLVIIVAGLFLTHYVHNVYVASNQSRNYGPIWVQRIFQPYKAFYTKSSLPEYETGFVSIWRFTRL